MFRRWQNRGTGWDQLRGTGPLTHRLRKLTTLERLVEAKAFLDSFMRRKRGRSADFQQRWAEIRRDLIRHGFYEHTPDELAFGAKLAWRNHARCIGRLYWDGLEVRDCRHISTSEEIFDDLCKHLSLATGDGRISSVISIYPPAKPGEQPSYVESPQLVRYAGYLGSDGRVTGDRGSVDATRVARSLGWQPPENPGSFDLLPVIMRDSCDQRHIFELPAEIVRQVAIRHPEYPELEELGLRWYAVPVVSDMILTVGGIDYPCAPFNGFYMCTEIASRNLVDRGRYNLLAPIAETLGLNPGGASPFWRDTAVTELNRAVLNSYQEDGVTMVDHHSASDQFMRFCGRETARGRSVSADWAWVVPPQASSLSEVFHLGMKDLRSVPNFYRSRASDGKGLVPRFEMGQAPFLHRCLQAARRNTLVSDSHG